MKKEEYEPLFGPGFHDVSLENLNETLTQLLVEPFPNSKCRADLLQNLFVLIEKIKSDITRVFLEMWIDGSFVTKKEEPKDIDIVIMYAAGAHVSQELQNHDRWKKIYCCDVYYVEFGNRLLKDYYEDWFGSDRNNCPKGIIRICF